MQFTLQCQLNMLLTKFLKWNASFNANSEAEIIRAEAAARCKKNGQIKLQNYSRTIQKKTETLTLFWIFSVSCNSAKPAWRQIYCSQKEKHNQSKCLLQLCKSFCNARPVATPLQLTTALQKHLSEDADAASMRNSLKPVAFAKAAVQHCCVTLLRHRSRAPTIFRRTFF